MSQSNTLNPLGVINPYRVKCPGSFVENYDCCSGRRSAYMPGGETWDARHMYRPSNFNPFVVHGNIPYGPRSVGGCVPSGYRLPEDHHKHRHPTNPNYRPQHAPPQPHPLLKEDFYNSSANSWTTRGNVTPANGITYGTYMTPANKVEGYKEAATCSPQGGICGVVGSETATCCQGYCSYRREKMGGRPLWGTCVSQDDNK